MTRLLLLYAIPVLAVLFLVSSLSFAANLTRTPLEEWEYAEDKLANAIMHLNTIKSERDDIYGAWTSNKEEIRDAKVSGIVSSVFAGADPIDALEDAVELAINGTFDISDDITLTGLLDTAISETNSQLNRAKAWEGKRDYWYPKYVTWWQSQSSQPPLQKKYFIPAVNSLTFSCYGGCTVFMYSSYDAKNYHYVERCGAPPYKTLADYVGGCKEPYYKCSKENDWHKVRYCNKNLASGEDCPWRYRDCTPLSREHSMSFKTRCSDTANDPTTVTCLGCKKSYDPNSSSAYSHRERYFACHTHKYYHCQPPSASEKNRHIYQTLPCGEHTVNPCRAGAMHKEAKPCPTDANGQACDYKTYYACSEHSHTYPSTNSGNSVGNPGNSTPSDETPNCPDCTSHCSSPCSCSNSGTCNGSVYTPPSTPSTPTTPPTTPSPPTTVACGGAAWTGCADSVSSRTQHKVSSCSNCGNHYWTCMSGAVERHTEVKTCKRTGCGASLTRCQNGPEACSINGGYHWL